MNFSCSLLNSEMMFGVPTFSLRTVVVSAATLPKREIAEKAMSWTEAALASVASAAFDASAVVAALFSEVLSGEKEKDL